MWHSFFAVLLAVSLVVQVAIALAAAADPLGHAVGTLRGTNAFMRVFRVISFFTIQSNVLCLVAFVIIARRPRADGRLFRLVRLASMVGISVTGVVYATVLAPTHDPNGIYEVSTNLVFHYVTPLATVVGWWLFGPRPRIDRTDMLALVWPCAWFGWALVHGAITDWYPYPFVDVVTHGYLVVFRNAVAVVAVLGLVTVLFRWGDRRLQPAPSD